MKYFFTTALLAASAFAIQLDSEAEASSTWTTVTVKPPKDGCCTTGWTSGCQNTINNALNKASANTILELESGTYCNSSWLKTHKYAKDYRHQPIAKITNKSNIKITAKDTTDMPKLIFDGLGAFTIKNSSGISFTYLDISGPNLDISGTDASDNHDRTTGHNDGGCGQYTETQCANYASNCSWSSSQNYCSGISYYYYSGQGFAVYTSTDLTFQNLSIHHCPSAAIHTQQSDDILFDSNLVYGNTWWTTGATSAVAFAQCEGSGTHTVTNNAVYGNRNFMPFYQASAVAGFGSGTDNYGTYLQDYIIDGQGIYTTRATDYTGTFVINDNVVFDTGINGISIQKTTNPDVTVHVEGNTVFDNGRTSATWEGRQNAGGVVINSGGSTIDASATFVNNSVTSAAYPDRTYQCFGSCEFTSDSEDNTACGGSPNSTFDDSAFDDSVDCDSQDDANQAIRATYPSSQMPVCPQYTPFREADGYDCVDSTL